MSSKIRVQNLGFAGKIGVARRDITPPVGIYARQWGAAVHDVAEGVHRPLVLTAFYLQEGEGGDPLILISMDGFLFRSPEDEYAIRGALLETFGIGSERVMVNLSHTHASCSVSTSDADKPGGDLIAPYLEKIRAAAVDAAREAQTTAAASLLSWGEGRCGLARNRDLRDPDADRFVCGYNPEGSADDTLLVGRITRDADGKTIGTLINYACHPTTLAWDNRLISPDFVGATREVVERETGAPVGFLQGASGELAPRRQYSGDVGVADANGRELGFAALSVLAAMLPPRSTLAFAGVQESGAPLALWELEPVAAGPGRSLAAESGTVDLPLKPQEREEELLEQLEQCSDRTMRERLERKLKRQRHLGNGPSCPMPYWVWRVGDMVMVAHPNEAYSLLQTELRRRFAPSPVVVMNLTNGQCISYLYPFEKGGLELYQVWVSPFEADALGRLIEGCSSSIERLNAEAKNT